MFTTKISFTKLSFYVSFFPNHIFMILTTFDIRHSFFSESYLYLQHLRDSTLMHQHSFKLQHSFNICFHLNHIFNYDLLDNRHSSEKRERRRNIFVETFPFRDKNTTKTRQDRRGVKIGRV